MKRALLVVCGALVVSCGEGDRLSLWQVAFTETALSPECLTAAPVSSSSDLLGVSMFELWQGEGKRRVLAVVGGAYECTLEGVNLTCQGTERLVAAYPSGTTVWYTLTRTKVVLLTATIDGDRMTGEGRSTIDVTCEGNCEGVWQQRNCVASSTFRAIRLHGEAPHSF
jgi:hypothetical protein